jgi:hypothetical protein
MISSLCFGFSHCTSVGQVCKANRGVDSQQYRTVHGAIPMIAVPDQLSSVPAPGTRTRSRYPHEYRNENRYPGGQGEEFAGFMQAPGGGQLQVYPIATPGNQHNFNYHRRSATAWQMNRPIHPNERAGLTRNPRNDPGQTRVVVQEQSSGSLYVVGVVAHPPRRSEEYERPPLEPLNRHGRQYPPGTRTSYPPSNVEAGVLSGIEQRYQGGRRRRHLRAR